MSRHAPPDSRDRGAVAVEFALLLPLALLIIFFTLALGLRTFYAAAAEFVARDVARQGSIETGPGLVRSYPNQAELQDKARGSLGGAVLSRATVTRTLVTDPGVSQSGEGDLLTVTVTSAVPGVAGLQAFVNAVPGPPLNLSFLSTVSQSATVRLE